MNPEQLILYNLISCTEICKPGCKLWSEWIHFTKFYSRRDESPESEWERVIWLAIFSGVTVKDRGRVNLRSSVPKELGAKLWNVKWPKEALQKYWIILLKASHVFVSQKFITHFSSRANHRCNLYPRTLLNKNISA